MGWNHLGVLVLGLCCAAHVVWGQGYVNIAPGKTYMSSRNSYPASNAADGNTAQDPYFYSNYGYGHFWEVDLGRTYPVHNINVWGRYENGVHLTPFNITVDGRYCVNVNSTQIIGGSYNISVNCSSLLYGQRVRLTKNTTGPTYLILSELEILACTPGFSGDNCDQTCQTARCLDNTCHPDTGLCMECGGNFNGSTCSGCVDGRHGATCNTTCSPAGCQTCQQHSGNCTACKPFYNLEHTSQCKACKDGFSKHNSSICSPCSTSCKDRKCNGDTGDCTQGCRPGFHGDQCEESCSDITNQCVQCNQSGQCTACSGHFQPPQCTACREGFYLKTEGADHCTECTWTCHNNIPCNHSTGDCDMCLAGWEGPRCLQSMKDESSQQSSVPVGSAILGAGLMLTVAVISVLVFLCWKHRSQKTLKDAETVAASSSDPVTASNNVYTAPPTASSSISPSASAQAGDVTPHVIRDPGNTYEQLRIYSNMVFDREAHSEPEPRGTDATTALSTSEHVHVSVEHVYANTSSATKERKPRKKKAN